MPTAKFRPTSSIQSLETFYQEREAKQARRKLERQKQQQDIAPLTPLFVPYIETPIPLQPGAFSSDVALDSLGIDDWTLFGAHVEAGLQPPELQSMTYSNLPVSDADVGHSISEDQQIDPLAKAKDTESAHLHANQANIEPLVIQNSPGEVPSFETQSRAIDLRTDSTVRLSPVEDLSYKHTANIKGVHSTGDCIGDRPGIDTKMPVSWSPEPTGEEASSLSRAEGTASADSFSIVEEQTTATYSVDASLVGDLDRATRGKRRGEVIEGDMEADGPQSAKRLRQEDATAPTRASHLVVLYRAALNSHPTRIPSRKIKFSEGHRLGQPVPLNPLLFLKLRL
ncbi:hypothetical protein F5Y16DRAFT_406992 [Xylariaceae sp. FL0255]|nr:hypothetical protein F5Y16DRAFT_406992 [Xylariaceae sp. FL0255]